MVLIVQGLGTAELKLGEGIWKGLSRSKLVLQGILLPSPPA